MLPVPARKKKEPKRHLTHPLRPVERVDGRDRDVHRRHELALRLRDGACWSDVDERRLDVHALGLHEGADWPDIEEGGLMRFVFGVVV